MGIKHNSTDPKNNNHIVDWDTSVRFDHFLQDLTYEVAEQLTSRHFTHFTNTIRFLDNNREEIQTFETGAVPLPAAIQILEKMGRYLIFEDNVEVRESGKLLKVAETRSRLLAIFKEALKKIRPKRLRELTQHKRYGIDWNASGRFQRFLKDLSAEAVEFFPASKISCFTDAIRFLDNQREKIISRAEGVMPLAVAINILEKMGRYFVFAEDAELLDRGKLFITRDARSRLLITFKDAYSKLQAREMTELPPPDTAWHAKPSEPRPVISEPSSHVKASEWPTPEPYHAVTSEALMSSYKDACPICMGKMSLNQLSVHIVTKHEVLMVTCRLCGIRVKPQNLANHLLKKHHGDLEGPSSYTRINKRKVFPEYGIQTRSASNSDAKAQELTDRTQKPNSLMSIVTGPSRPNSVLPKDPLAFFIKICRAFPTDLVEQFADWGVTDALALLQYLDRYRTNISADGIPISADEAMMIINRAAYAKVMAVHGRPAASLHKQLRAFFNNTSNLSPWVRNGSTSGLKGSCPVCGEMYALDWLDWHVHKKHPVSPIPCRYCKERVPLDELLEHLTTRHLNKLLPVYVLADADDVGPATAHPDQLSKIAEPRHLEGIEDAQPLPADEPKARIANVPAANRFANLHEFHPIRRGRRKMKIKIETVIEDRGFFVSQAARVKTERANLIHQETLEVLRSYLTTLNIEMVETFLLDGYAEMHGPNIFEVKSIGEQNENNQVRHAVAQLYEYRYLYRKPDARLWLVLSNPLETEWLLDYLLNDRQINVVWIDDGRLSGPSAPELTG